MDWCHSTYRFSNASAATVRAHTLLTRNHMQQYLRLLRSERSQAYVMKEASHKDTAERLIHFIVTNAMRHKQKTSQGYTSISSYSVSTGLASEADR